MVGLSTMQGAKNAHLPRLPKCPDKKINPAKSINTNFVDLKQRFSLLSGESTIFDKGSFLS